MGDACCVEGCGATSRDHTYFKFPISLSLKRKWLAAVKVAGKVTIYSSICNQHFLDTEYELVRGKMRLKGKVVPSMRTGVTFNKSTLEDQNDCDCKEPHDAFNGEIQGVETLHSEAYINDIGYQKKETLENITNNDTSYKKSLSDKNHNGESESVKKGEYGSQNNRENEKSETKIEIDRDDNMSECGSQKDKENDRKSESPSDEKNECSSRIDRKKDNSVKIKDIDCDNDKISESSSTKKSKNENNDGLSQIIKDKNNECGSANDRKKDNIDKKSEIKSDATKDRKKQRLNCDESNQDNCIQRLPEKSGIASINIDKEDIEDIITNYHIKQTKRLCDLDTRSNDIFNPYREKDIQNEQVDSIEIEVDPTMLELSNEPTFIEISTEKSTSVDNETEGSRDCMMLLESVQCDVDPSLLLDHERDHDNDTHDSDNECIILDDKSEKPFPISLVTSSDEDDVILQEPKIDTVDVSDETDEDDVPLVRLIKPVPDIVPKRLKQNLCTCSIVEYYCPHCPYTAVSRSDYNKHLKSHNKGIKLCPACAYSTPSRPQLMKHMKQHKQERKFKCNQCKYTAKHHMSLMYHLRVHGKTSTSWCLKCGSMFDTLSALLKHTVLCIDESSNNRAVLKYHDKNCRSTKKKYNCGHCEYATDRRTDMKRHRHRKHKCNEDDYSY